MPKRKRVLTPSQIQKGNERNKTNYDRISFFAPKSLNVKDRIKAVSSSMNNYVLQAVLTSLEKDEKPVTAAAARSDIAPREEINIEKDVAETIAALQTCPDLSIDDMDLPVRAYNAVKRCGLKSCGELAAYLEQNSITHIGIHNVKSVMQHIPTTPAEAAAPVPSPSDDIPLTALDLSENDFKTLFLNNCHTVKDVKNTISALSSTDITTDLYTRVSTAAIDYLNARKTD